MNNSTSKPKRLVLVVRLADHLQNLQKPSSYADIARDTLQGMKSGKVTPRTVKTDYEIRAEETNAILRKAGRK